VVVKQDKVLIQQWFDEILTAYKLSTQILATMNKKVRMKFGAEMGATSSQHTIAVDGGRNNSDS
jgi:hypothetical protein